MNPELEIHIEIAENSCVYGSLYLDKLDFLPVYIDHESVSSHSIVSFC